MSDIINTILFPSDVANREYAATPQDALNQLNKVSTPGATPGQTVTMPTDSNTRPSNINKGLHNLYTRSQRERFGESRANYMAETVQFRDEYVTFSGADTTVSILFKNGIPIVLDGMQTLTYSLFSPQTPVYALGSHMASGFIRGPRTVAGSLIFTVFDRHPLITAFHEAFAHHTGDINCLDQNYLSDELPSFDLQVTFMNEYGQSAGLTVHDVRITSEGQVMSIEDMITENTMQYIASDITPMQPDFVQEPR